MPAVTDSFPHRVKVIENIFIPMPDGIRLAAKVWLPEDAEGAPVPALLEYIPYRKRDGTRTRDQALHMYVAGHGYACVRLDIRGSGDSDGIITDEYTGQEQQDGCDAIAWIAAQGWCDGTVSMIGISWGGFNGLQIAARQPPALASVITVGSTDDRYATDIHWVGGCLSKDNFDWSATMLAHNDLPPDAEIVGEGWREAWLARARANTPWIIEWMKHQRRDDYWKQGSVCEDFARIKVPVYAVSGWADNYSEAVPRLLADLTVPRLGLIGPWAHSYPYDVAVEPAIGWLDEVVRWLDHWHKGRDTGMLAEPMYRVWMQESVPPSTCYLERPGRWVAEVAWPSPRIEMRVLPLNPDGSLGPPTPSLPHTGGGGRERPETRDDSNRASPPLRGEGRGEGRAPPTTLTIRSPLWVGLAAGEVGRYGEDAEWPPDQREDDGGSLVFLSAPLPDRTEILGAPQLHLTFSSDKPQALVAVRLNDVAPDGRSTRVTVGLLNLTHRDSHEHPTALTPGETYQATVDLDDIAHAFPAGNRIAVSISTTYWPIAWPSPELATLTVHTGASHLILPVRPPDPADAALRPFGPPTAAPNTPSTYDTPPAQNRRRVTRDLLSGEMTVDFPRWTFSKHLPDIDRTVTSSGLVRYTVTDGDPLSARMTTDYAVTIARPDGDCGHRSTGSMSCDATHFIIGMTLEVTENGATVFANEWHERIPRDMV